MVNFRVGVDVGGTNTDAVLLDVSRIGEATRGVLAHCKRGTTADVSEGIENAVRAVIKEVDPSAIASLTIGTTHFINAVSEHDSRRLSKVAVVRLCGPYTRQCPPFIDFPDALRKITEGHVGYVDGGFEIDGREIMPINEAQIVEECRTIKSKGLKAVVIAGVYSSLDSDGSQEPRARDIVLRELGADTHVVCSGDVGQVGYLERENASILNAAILAFAQRTVRGFLRAMKRLGLKCALYLTQNDGTLTTAEKAAKLPIRTFASGPTNSMRGASFLAGLGLQPATDRKPTIVVDIGGTTTDVGVLLPSGFPRQAAAYIEVAGCRTSFSMPDVLSIGLGGGSRVRSSSASEVTTVGPDSVGHYLTRDAKVFGGDVLTATDIIVAAERAEVGDPARVRTQLPRKTIDDAQSRIKALLEEAIDRMKTTPEDVTVLMVGGGSIIAPKMLEGVGEIMMPPFFDVANAVGAAMAKVSGEVDTIEILADRKIGDVIEGIKARAIRRAVEAGADPGETEVVEITNLPVQYVTNQATRIIVKAAGELDLSHLIAATASADVDIPEDPPEPPKEVLKGFTERQTIDPREYRPLINDKREWEVSETDLEWIAEGCGVLGTGGGGSPYPPMLMTRECIRQGKKVRVVDPMDVPEEARFLRAMFMGAPSVSLERIQGGNEIPAAAKALLQFMGIQDVAGTISDEIGGGNGVQPLLAAAEMDRPVLDGDLMGRAYPNLDQSLPGAYQIEGGIWPCASADGIGNVLIMPAAANPRFVEDILRATCTVMGSMSALICAPLTRKDCQSYGVARTVSQAWRIGRALAICRKTNDMSSVPRAILNLQTGKCLFVGKIIDVQREVRKGFTWGQVTIAPLKASEQETEVKDTEVENDASVPRHGLNDRIVIPFQNEFIYAYLLKSDGTQQVLVTVPDLITVLDSQSGSSLGTPDLRYGLRVTVIALAGDPKWTQTPEGLKAGGPSSFGLDMPYTPVGGEYQEPSSVIQEFVTVRD